MSLIADPEYKSSYYMMIQEKELMKIHGSSLVSKVKRKPKWVSCQNMVKSSITGRKMCKMVIPIDEKVLDVILKTKIDRKDNMGDKIGLGNNVVLKRGKKMAEMEIAQKLEYFNIPTSVLRFYRSKNHNEFLRETLKNNTCYLETNEDAELVEYFYLQTCKLKSSGKEDKNARSLSSVKKTESIVKMNQDFFKLACKTIEKRQLLMTLSDQTKLHVNQYGNIVDILQCDEFLDFVI